LKACLFSNSPSGLESKGPLPHAHRRAVFIKGFANFLPHPFLSFPRRCHWWSTKNFDLRAEPPGPLSARLRWIGSLVLPSCGFRRVPTFLLFFPRLVKLGVCLVALCRCETRDRLVNARSFFSLFIGRKKHPFLTVLLAPISSGPTVFAPLSTLELKSSALAVPSSRRETILPRRSHDSPCASPRLFPSHL